MPSTLVLASLCVASIGVVAVDQISKHFAATRLPVGEFRRLTGRIGFRFVRNARGAIVPLSTRTAVHLWIVAIAAVCYVAAFAVALPFAGVAGLGLAVGGATSNLLDRVVHGAVIDFIAVGWWPIFNLADAAMVIGAVLVVAISV
ncbi:MAG: signal peptidase II [Gemmatimonadaceae bacterium]